MSGSVSPGVLSCDFICEQLFQPGSGWEVSNEGNFHGSGFLRRHLWDFHVKTPWKGSADTRFIPCGTSGKDFWILNVVFHRVQTTQLESPRIAVMKNKLWKDYFPLKESCFSRHLVVWCWCGAYDIIRAPFKIKPLLQLCISEEASFFMLLRQVHRYIKASNPAHVHTDA